MSGRVDRAVLVAVIERDIRWLVKHRKRRELDAITELAGWIYNFTKAPAAKLSGDVLRAIAPVLPLDDLIHVAHGAVFYRHRDIAGVGEADALADKALSDAGVDVAAMGWDSVDAQAVQ